MEIFRSRPSAQKVDAAPTELPGTRSSEQKSSTSLFDQTVDLIEQGREPLDLIDDHNAIFGPQLFRQALRALAQPKIHGTIQEIVDPRPLHAMSNQETFAGLPWSQKEVRLLLNEILEV
jgi:hypothetical protein